MPSDTRLSRMLHVLIHMDHIDGPVTSDVIGRMLETNPVVVRRTMSGLKAAGYVTSGKGHGGGWALARPLDRISLRDVHAALGGQRLFAIGLADENSRCLVEQAVNSALSQALAEAEQALLERLGEVSVASVAHGLMGPGFHPSAGVIGTSA